MIETSIRNWELRWMELGLWCELRWQLTVVIDINRKIPKIAPGPSLFKFWATPHCQNCNRRTRPPKWIRIRSQLYEIRQTSNNFKERNKFYWHSAGFLWLKWLSIQNLFFSFKIYLIFRRQRFVSFIVQFLIFYFRKTSYFRHIIHFILRKFTFKIFFDIYKKKKCTSNL